MSTDSSHDEQVATIRNRAESVAERIRAIRASKLNPEWQMQRDMELIDFQSTKAKMASLEQQVTELTAALEQAKATINGLRRENERLRSDQSTDRSKPLTPPNTQNEDSEDSGEAISLARGAKLLLGVDDEGKRLEWRPTSLPNSLHELREGVSGVFVTRDKKERDRLSKLDNALENVGKCACNIIKDKSSTMWTAASPGFYACQRCTSFQIPCIIRRGGQYEVLPLAPQARLKKAASGYYVVAADLQPIDINFWIAPIAKISNSGLVADNVWAKEARPAKAVADSVEDA